MTESALLQILSLGGIVVGVGIAALTYWAITIELKRAEPNSSLTQALWAVVAGGLILGLFGGWGQLQLSKQKPGTMPSNLAAPSTSKPTGTEVKTLTSPSTPVVTTSSSEAELAALKARLAKLEANVAKYRALQNAFAANREKWQDVLDKAGVIVGNFRSDVQTELKAIREQLDVKLVEEEK